jgi:hypothetical protein
MELKTLFGNLVKKGRLYYNGYYRDTRLLVWIVCNRLRIGSIGVVQ